MDAVIAYRSGGHSERIMTNFALGAGIETAPAAIGLLPGDAAIWGLLRGSADLLKQCMREGRRYYYLDHAYFVRGHPRANYRVAIDGLQTTGPVLDRPSDRWDRWAPETRVRPWRDGGAHILVCPPSDAVARFFGLEAWLSSVKRQLLRYTDRPIKVRTKQDAFARPLGADLRGCHAVVSFQSMVAVEAVCGGVPVFVSEHSAAAPVGHTELALIESPARPDRNLWLRHLAYSQFHITEIRDGTAWRILQETIRMRAAAE